MSAVKLNASQTEALNQIKARVDADFPVVDFILYGSATRGEADEESDLDLLIVVSEPISRYRRHEITDIVFEVNLQFETNFSTLVVDRATWETGMISVLPIRSEILKDGVSV